ncbi:MAG TPA: YlcI/YnfO family protein [Burkholderiaceae bacterium]|nr:YlcI/YnfO family protein [Burkholderiaceae bacterium]
MKSAQIPPVRVTPAVRQEVESALREGESLSQFVEASVLAAARRRRLQQAFLARGRASLAKAKVSGDRVPLDQALADMRARLQARVAPHSTIPERSAGNT